MYNANQDKEKHYVLECAY